LGLPRLGIRDLEAAAMLFRGESAAVNPDGSDLVSQAEDRPTGDFFGPLKCELESAPGVDFALEKFRMGEKKPHAAPYAMVDRKNQPGQRGQSKRAEIERRAVSTTEDDAVGSTRGAVKIAGEDEIFILQSPGGGVDIATHTQVRISGGNISDHSGEQRGMFLAGVPEIESEKTDATTTNPDFEPYRVSRSGTCELPGVGCFESDDRAVHGGVLDPRHVDAR